MFTLNIKAGDFKDMLTLMSLPGGKDSYIFDPIAPTFNPDGTMTLIAKETAITQVTSFKTLQISGIDEPTTLPIKASKMLSYMGLYSRDDTIQVTYNPGAGEWQIIDLTDGGMKDDIFIPGIVLKDVKSTESEAPFSLDTNGRPLFKGGTIAPNIMVAIDASHIHALISRADLVKVDPRIFNFDIFNNLTMLGKIGSITKRDKDRIKSTLPAIETKDLTTDAPKELLCSVAYALGFEEVMRNLKGIVELYTLQSGPLWIEQTTDIYRVGYLIAPAAVI